MLHRPLPFLPTIMALLSLLFPHYSFSQTSLQVVASGLSSPVFLTAAPGDANRLFLVEQGASGSAAIRVMDRTTGVINPYLTLTGLSTGGERGLLGLAFHPDFLTNGYFYVYASVPGGGNHTSVVRRYSALGDPATSNMADAASAFPILSFSQPFSNHNGGWLGFNPNLSGSDPQYLYIAAGDGGSANDPGNRAQDITNQRLGKLLRVDVNGDDFPANANENYAVPPDNPFVGVTGDDEIWAYGLRNPWRNSFDRETGNLWIADVGQDTVEEINLQAASSPGGENYGWRVQEGTNCFDNSQTGGNPPCGSPVFTPPIHQYGHNGGSFGGYSVSGGYNYHGSVAQFEGLYFFADYVTNNIWTIDPYAVNVSQSVLRRNGILPPTAGTSIDGISSFGEDNQGEVYLLSHLNGRAFRISSTARTIVWDGAQPIGNPGDGMNWEDPNNWTRDGVVDAPFIAKDKVDFATSGSIQLQQNRQVGGVVFSAPGVSLHGNTLTVLSGNVEVAAGVTGTIHSSLAAETVQASIRKLGGGRLNVNGTAGQTVVLAGTFGGNGTIQYLKAFRDTTVSPGESAGQLSVVNDYTQLAGATLEMEITGTTPGTEYDQLHVGRTALLDGILAIQLPGSYTDPAPGNVDVFSLLTAATLTGTFDEVRYDGLTLVPAFGVSPNGSFTSHVGDGVFRSVVYDNNQVALENYTAIPGDANGDRFVDGADFNIWNTHKYTAGNDWLTGDFNGDGFTDVSDFNIWNANKFTTVVTSVPEPIGHWLPIAMPLVWHLRRRRRT